MLGKTVVAIALSAVSCGAFAQDTRSFDGNWWATVACPPTANGTRGYTWRFPAQVGNGMLAGVYGTEGHPPWMRLEGRIQANGTAMLVGRGQTGDPDYAVGRVNTGTPFNYRAEARFSGSQGTGRRLDLRPCDLTFVRQ